MSAEFATAANITILPVPEVEARDFTTAYAKSCVFNIGGAPLVVRGYAAHWPAATKWTFEYLAAQDTCNTEVALSMGVEEVATATVKRSSTFRQYCLELMASQASHADGPQAATYPATAAGSSSTASANNLPVLQLGAGSHPGYLKQCELLSLFPSLQGDIGALPFADSMCFITPYGWIGAQGAHTGLHQDDEANALVVLRGRKRVRLVHPAAAPVLSVNNKYDSGTNCCDASILFPDFEAFPSLGQLAHPVYDVELRAGDALLFDVNWWHEALTLEHAVSLNFFASSMWDMVVRGVPRGLGILAHEAGLYRAGSCVCHSDAARKAAGDATIDAPSQATVPLLVLGSTAAIAAAVWLWKRRSDGWGVAGGAAGEGGASLATASPAQG